MNTTIDANNKTENKNFSHDRSTGQAGRHKFKHSRGEIGANKSRIRYMAMIWRDHKERLFFICGRVVGGPLESKLAKIWWSLREEEVGCTDAHWSVFWCPWKVLWDLYAWFGSLLEQNCWWVVVFFQFRCVCVELVRVASSSILRTMYVCVDDGP